MSGQRFPKVCMLVSGALPFDARIFHRASKSLQKAGFEVVVVVPAEGGDQVLDGIPIRAVRLPRSRLERLVVTPWLVMVRALRERPAICHFHNPELMGQALLLTLLGKTVVYDVREDLPDEIPHKEWVPRFLARPIAWLFRRLEEHCASRCHAVVPAGEEIAERLQPRNARTVLIRNVPLLEEFLELPAGPRQAVVHLGVMGADRVTRQIVEAMALLPPESNVPLILAGQFVPASLLKELQRMPGWFRVDYRGVIPRHQMPAVWAEAAVSLVLYSPSPNHYDIRSGKFYESLAAGVPVIASDFPRWRAMVEGNGFGLVVDPLNPRAIAEAIEYLMTHREEAAAMGRRARQAFLEKYNWTVEEGKLLQLYRELCASRENRSGRSEGTKHA